jgi:hypothetical protein
MRRSAALGIKGRHMPIKMATWLHGNGAQPEFAPFSQRRMAGSGLFGGTDGSHNYFHFPLTTPVIVDDRRLLLSRIFVFARQRFCVLRDVYIYDADYRAHHFIAQPPPLIKAINGVMQAPPDHTHPRFAEGLTMFTPSEPLPINLGLSISVKVNFDSTVINGITSPQIRNLGAIEFHSVGADWVVAP